jgi:DNA polymerase III subunit epsilon
MMREIVLDTETTGLDPNKGDRLIEIGCIEIVNRLPTGREYHCFINPERDVPPEAQAVHGITTQFLADKPVFARVVEDFLSFIGDDVLVIHNANFDIGFLNAELQRAKKLKLNMDRVVDTLQLARRKHPGGPNNLDALCKRYAIDTSKRIKHGALIDCELLAKVYIELLGERQALLGLARANSAANSGKGRTKGAALSRPATLPPRLSAEEEEAHRVFAKGLGPSALWRRFFPDGNQV